MEFNRRRFLQAGGTAALMGTAGCDAPRRRVESFRVADLRAVDFFEADFFPWAAWPTPGDTHVSTIAETNSHRHQGAV